MFISLGLNQVSKREQIQCRLICSSCNIAMRNKVIFAVLIVATAIVLGALEV